MSQLKQDHEWIALERHHKNKSVEHANAQCTAHFGGDELTANLHKKAATAHDFASRHASHRRLEFDDLAAKAEAATKAVQT